MKTNTYNSRRGFLQAAAAGVAIASTLIPALRQASDLVLWTIAPMHVALLWATWHLRDTSPAPAAA